MRARLATSRSPSGPRRRSRRSRIDTTRRRPSGSQPRPEGSFSTRTTASQRPSRSTVFTRWSCMSENQSLPSRQRGPSGNARPSSSTSVDFIRSAYQRRRARWRAFGARAGMILAMGRPVDERGGALRWMTALWLLAIIVLSATASLRPALLLRWTPYLPGRDKTGHFLLMGGFAAVAVLGFAGRRFGARTISVWLVLSIVTAIVVSEEGLQRWLPSRTLSLEDLA